MTTPLVIDDICMRCGRPLPRGRDFDNHYCEPPKCTCWRPTAEHQIDCPVRRHETFRDRQIEAMLTRSFGTALE